ncbi:MAG: AIPR family protein [Clostridia bacterium]|nr:AIPR family protein [Clostridia bacterium]
MEGLKFINDKIHSMKTEYSRLSSETDDHIFATLCVRATYFKNPSLAFNNEVIDRFLTDSTGDGGVDAILSDPSSEASDLILCQAKHWQTIKYDDVRNAVSKLIAFYKCMDRGEYEIANSKVQREFLSLNAEVGDESKVCFVLYVSAPKNGIREDRIQKLLIDEGLDPNRYEISLYFINDIIEEINDLESRRPSVEVGKIFIDQVDNYLQYNDDSIIVNVSAFSIKDLYARNGTNLLSGNLRYFIKKKDIDSSINDTIANSPDTFWYKNNGITIICRDFEICSKEVKLKDFSIVNGGQTTTLLYKSKDISKEHDLYLPCKIIKIIGDTEDEKNLFRLEIAKATNSQKAIKQIDLKANSPEQVRFSRAMREAGLFYQTKRGEDIPKDYKDDYKNSDLVEVGKLCLAGIFQLPGSSRSKPSTLYAEKYYNPIFNGGMQQKICLLLKELLYVDYYFRKIFIHKFDKANEQSPFADEIIPFAHNARTICISFVVFASQYFKNQYSKEDLKTILNYDREDTYDTYLYDIFKKIGDFAPLFNKQIFNNKDEYDKVLYKLFDLIISTGQRYFRSEKKHDNKLVESNFLKKDKNYYGILSFDWESLSENIRKIFNKIS